MYTFHRPPIAMSAAPRAMYAARQVLVQPPLIHWNKTFPQAAIGAVVCADFKLQEGAYNSLSFIFLFSYELGNMFQVCQPPGLALLAHPRKHKSPLIQKRANPDAQAREQSACLPDSQNNNRTTFPRHYHRGVLDGLDAGWDGMLLYAYHTIRKYTYKYKPRRVLTTFTHLAFAG